MIPPILRNVEWHEVPQPESAANPDGLPFPTHSGVLKIGEVELRCYRLSTGQAIIDADDFTEFFLSLLAPDPDEPQNPTPPI